MQISFCSCSRKSLTSSEPGKAKLHNPAKGGRPILIGSPRWGGMLFGHLVSHRLREVSTSVAPSYRFQSPFRDACAPVGHKECQPVCRSVLEFGPVLTRLREGQDLRGGLKAPCIVEPTLGPPSPAAQSTTGPSLTRAAARRQDALARRSRACRGRVCPSTAFNCYASGSLRSSRHSDFSVSG